MRGKGFLLYSRLVQILLFLIVLVIQLTAATVSVASSLNDVDCQKCHRFQVQKISAAGGKHASAIGCQDCHPQHPPNGKQIISACNSCHFEHPHFQLDDCLHCHTDPHQPLVSLRDTIKPEKKACMSCHDKVGQQMSDSPSRHAQLFCTRCHSRHKEFPDCLDCHVGHQQNQTTADCVKCHQAHQPLRINPVGYIPAGFCRPCHIRQTNDLAATATNHGGIQCTYCHKGEHPAIPKCQDCHGLPHTQAIHSQFRKCLDCHGDAHNLISGR